MALIDLLPPGMYTDNKTMQELQKILDGFIEQLDGDLENTVDNCFILSAEELLKRYEKICGITTNSSLSNQIRAEAIIAKLRGTSTCTIQSLKNVINSYFSEAGVSEDYSNYFFSVLFSGSFGDAARVLSLKRDIDAVKPAHLTYDLRYQDDEDGEGYVGSYANTIIDYTFEQVEEEA